jgi:thymidine phosphorylase
MLPQEIIRTKRDGGSLDDGQIAQFIAGVTDGSVSEGQVAAFAMAVFFRGMTTAECAALTRAMMHSGMVLHWHDQNLPGPVLDKHSTGGVGDGTSLVLAPIVAACGGFVPMISGRGLGHTGGTLDKFESIPGYNASPSLARFREVVRGVGCAIIGQTADLAPADKRIYAIRDVTATVESVPLITASILSKKLAAGLHGLVMDVKAGNGAFMPTTRRARLLAQSIATVAGAAGVPTVSLVTDMHSPLGRAAGNAVEMHEAIGVLTRRSPSPRLTDLSLRLAAELLLIGGLARDLADATQRCQAALDSGTAAERFAQMVGALGGPHDILERPHRHLPSAPIARPVFAATSGVVTHIDTRAVGLAVVALGGGRTRPQDAIDHAVGLTDVAEHGSPVNADRPLAIVHARRDEQVLAAAEALRAAFVIDGARKPARRRLVQDRLTG